MAALVLSVSFAVKVPLPVEHHPELDHNPDESSHRDYIRLMVEQKGLVMFVPTKGRRPLPAPLMEKMQAREGMTELPEGVPSRDETHQPPLYYALAALVFAVTGGSLLALRLVALPFQLATVWVAWRAGKELFPERPEIAPAIAAFVAFLPIQAQLGGAISNDATTHFFCALIVWRIARFFAPHLAIRSVREGVLLGLFFGLGLLTKLTVLQLYPVLVLAAVLALRAKRLTLPEGVRLVGAAVGIGLLIAAPWLVRNQMLYGDPLAQTIYKATGPNFSPDEICTAFGWSSADYARNMGLRSLASFWYFLAPDLPPRQFVGPPLLLLLALLLTLAPLLGLYKASKEKTGEPVLGFAALVPLCLVPFFVKFIYEVFQAQGRYFLPSLLAVALVCVGGFAALTKKSGAAYAPAALLLLLSLWQLVGGGYAATR